MRDAYRDYLQKTVDERRIPGVGALVQRGGTVLFDEGVGFADREARRAVTSETIFGIGSLTKSFTALAIMQLVDAGKLRVADAAADYLPALAGSTNRQLASITLHHLLTNSSGMPPLPYLHNALSRSVLADPARDLLEVEEAKYLPAIDTADELVQAIADAAPKLLRAPGVIFSYCNDGFAMLGRIVEIVSGKAYETYVEEHILAPLGMTRSVFDPRRLEALGDATELYSYIGGYERVEHTPGWWEAPAMTSAGFLKCTTRDLARYAEVYMGRRPDLLSPASLATMTHPHARTGPSRHYGYGLMVQPDYHGRKLVEHGGNIKGVGAWLSIFPEEEVISAVLTNITGGPVGDMVIAGANLAVGLPIGAKRQEFATVGLTDAQAERLVGKFVSGEDTDITVRRTPEGAVTVDVGKLSLATRVVGESAVVVDANGQDALIEFIDPGPRGFEAATFGFRVLERVG